MKCLGSSVVDVVGIRFAQNSLFRLFFTWLETPTHFGQKRQWQDMLDQQGNPVTPEDRCGHAGSDNLLSILMETWQVIDNIVTKGNKNVNTCLYL